MSEKKTYGNSFSKKPQHFFEKSEFFGERKIVLEKYIFEKSSRMVKVIFYAELKSTSRIIFSPRKSGDIGWSKEYLFDTSSKMTKNMKFYARAQELI